ncbi:MAG TPA: thymidine phosphorylase [Cyanobacteria bacterium UBA9971]|nr:thymidine phosphorylase [Cyanobacteria bacterium UBA9971]
MRMVDVIARKKSGNANTQEEINFITKGILNGTVPDYQLSAWLMAVCLKGMTFDESYMLTQSVVNSGEIMDLSSLGDIIVDKHSTGGVGDKTTLVLAALLAAAGIPVAKLSGRGLGFTGGTIDKLESIKGFKAELSNDEFISQVKNVGAAIVSQTANLTPADKKMYELRDVTATIDSIPLIAASVVSKKFAAGSNVIVLDVKCGSGAFMKTLEEAEALSVTMTEIGKRAGKPIICVITSMAQPLGNTVGNGIEVYESIKTLQNQGPDDLNELCLYLGAISLVKAGKVKTIEKGKELLAQKLKDGSAFAKFKEMIKAQHGDIEYLENPDKLIQTKFEYELVSEASGYVSKLDALTVAKASKALGTGREKKEDPIDYTAGIRLYKKIGDNINKGEPLAKIYANSEQSGQAAKEILNQAYEISSKKPQIPELIIKVIE